MWPKARSAAAKGTRHNKRMYPYFVIAMSGLFLLGLVIGAIFYSRRNDTQTKNEVPPLESALEEEGEMVEEAVEKEVVVFDT